jgi:quercetin dioxygenase-like cupin family protein
MELNPKGKSGLLEKAVSAVKLTEQDEIVFKNKEDMNWEKMLPELGEDSPRFAILRVDPKTNATTLMIEFPKALHIPRHTHEKSEAHIILGGSHTFEYGGNFFDVKEHGYIYMPGKFIHEAWVPADSKAVIILEDGWKVDWLDGGPTAKDLGKGSPSDTKVNQ